jgi:hypothetical protein
LAQHQPLLNEADCRTHNTSQTARVHRNLDSWSDLKEFLKNTYVEKQMLDFHADQLFKSQQKKGENVSEWMKKIRSLGPRFREAALLNCTFLSKAKLGHPIPSGEHREHNDGTRDQCRDSPPNWRVKRGGAVKFKY